MENKDVATLINDLEKLHVRYETQHQALRKAELKEAKELVLDHHQKEVKATAKTTRKKDISIGDTVRILNSKTPQEATGPVIRIGSYYYTVKVAKRDGTHTEVRRAKSNLKRI